MELNIKAIIGGVVISGIAGYAAHSAIKSYRKYCHERKVTQHLKEKNNQAIKEQDASLAKANEEHNKRMEELDSLN